MICPQCRESIPADASVCPFCGLALTPATNQHCPACGAITAPNASFCRHCGTPLASRAYVPPPAADQASPPTTPYAKSRYAQPPIMRTVPLISPLPAATPEAPPQQASQQPFANADAPMTIPVLTASPVLAPPVPVLSPDETPTVLAMPDGADAHAPVSADDASTWSAVPPLMTPSEPEEIPFAMTAAAVEAASAPVNPDAPTAPDLPTSAPDVDELPDYETPDSEHPAIHAPKPPLPDYDTPDVERTAVHPSPAITPAIGRLTPINVADEAITTNGAGTVPHAPPSYPDAYTGPQAAHIDRPPLPASSATSTASTASAPLPPGSDNPIARFFGEQPVPSARTANNAIQRLWLRFLPPEWAVAPWISIPVGALVALVAGLLVTAIGLLFWSRAIGYLLDTNGAVATSAGLARAVLVPNLLQLFLLEHGVAMALALGSPGATGSFSALETLPLTGLSLLPACALILGGYVAAASDFSHRLRFSVLRGALIGPIYAILLLIVAVFGSSNVKLTQNTLIQLHPSVGHAFLAGLIGGTLLGALGGLLAVRRHHLFSTNRRPDLLAGASWGALIALGSGLLLALVALAAGVAAHAVGTVPSAATGQASGGLAGALSAVVVALALLLLIAPVAALWLFALGTGATIDSWFNAAGIRGGSGSATFGLLAAQHHPTSIAWYLLLLIPLASYIIGGRAAAHIARAESLRDGALAGWLMAVALSLLMLVLTLLSRVLISSESTLLGRHITTSLGIAPSAWAIFLLILIVGGIVGAMGGASVLLAPQPGAMLAPLASPLLLELEPVLTVARRPWDMLDAARAQRSSRTTLRVLLYVAIVLVALLGALFLLVVLIGLLVSHFAPISAVRGFDGFFAGFAVGAPLLLLASAAILATLRTLPPLLIRPQADVPDLPRYPRM